MCFFQQWLLVKPRQGVYCTALVCDVCLSICLRVSVNKHRKKVLNQSTSLLVGAFPLTHR